MLTTEREGECLNYTKKSGILVYSVVNKFFFIGQRVVMALSSAAVAIQLMQAEN